MILKTSLSSKIILISLLCSLSISNSISEQVHQHLSYDDDANDNKGYLSSLLNLLYEFLNASDGIIIYVGKQLVPSEGQKLFENSGIESPSFFLIVFSLSSTILIYLYIKFITSGTISETELNAIKDVLIKKQSDILKVEQETKSMREELEFMERKFDDKEKDEERMIFEKDELKIKMEEVMKERDELRKETKKLETKVSEDSSRLNDLKERRNAQGKQNKLLKDEFLQLKMNRSSLEGDILKKESDLSNSQEAALREKLQVITDQHYDLIHTEEEVSENLKHLLGRLQDLLKEREKFEREDEKYSGLIDHLTEENENLAPTLQRLMILEDKLVNDHMLVDDDGGDDNDGSRPHDDDDDHHHHLLVSKRLKEYADMSMTKTTVTSIEEDMDSLKHVLLDDQNDNKILQDEIEKAKSDLSVVFESYKKAEKASKAASIKLDVIINHFKDREKELTSKLSEFEERDHLFPDDGQSHKEKINGLMQLAHQYKMEAEMIQKEIEKAESAYKEKIDIMEHKSQESWMSYRRTEKDAKGLQQEVDGLSAQLQDARDELEKLEAKYNNIMAANMPRPQPMIPFPRPPLGVRQFYPPNPQFPPIPQFLPIPRPLEPDNMRSTPYGSLDKSFGHSPALGSRPSNDINSSNQSTPGSRRHPPPQLH